MICNGFAAEIYSFYVLGTLDPQEREEVDAHLSENCVRCREELSASRRAWVGVALAAPAQQPRAALRERVIRSVGGSEQNEARLRWWQIAPTVAAIALAALAGMEWRALHMVPQPAFQVPRPAASHDPALAALVEENRLLRQNVANGAQGSRPVPSQVPDNHATAIAELNLQLAQEREQVARTEQELVKQQAAVLSAQAKAEDAERRYQAVVSQPRPAADSAETQRLLAAAQARTKQLEQDIAEYRTLLVTARQRSGAVQYQALLADPNLRLVRLRPTAAGNAPSNFEGHALVASGAQLVFYASQLPSLPAGRAYQLWLIRGSAPAIVSAGVFRPDAKNRAVVQFEGAGLTSGISAIAVTDEPETGSPSPTGHKWLVGS